MTTTLEQLARADGAATTSPEARASYARRLRIRRGAGVVLLLIAMLWGHQRDQAARDRQPVLVVARPVAAGQPVTEADVDVAHVALDGDVEHLASSERRRVIGRVTTVDLRPGRLLLDDWLVAAGDSGEEKVMLPLPLKAGRFPPGLRAGDRVVVVVTAGDSVAARTDDKGGDDGMVASVVAVDGDRGGFGVSETVVTILIPKAELPRLAAAGGQGRVLLAASVP